MRVSKEKKNGINYFSYLVWSSSSSYFVPFKVCTRSRLVSVFLLFLTLKNNTFLLNNLMYIYICLEQFHCRWFDCFLCMCVSFVCVPIVVNIRITSLTFA